MIVQITRTCVYNFIDNDVRRRYDKPYLYYIWMV